MLNRNLGAMQLSYADLAVSKAVCASLVAMEDMKRAEICITLSLLYFTDLSIATPQMFVG